MFYLTNLLGSDLTKILWNLMHLISFNIILYTSIGSIDSTDINVLYSSILLQLSLFSKQNDKQITIITRG